MNKFKEKMTLNPIMTFIILIFITIVVSGVLSLLGTSATYDQIDRAGNYVRTLETVNSLFNFSGIKEIFTNTVSNFAAFAPLVMLIIILFGIGIMEKSGFLKTVFRVLTKRVKKNTVTFFLVLISMVSSIAGDLGFVVFIPISALLFLHGRRNPLIGIIASFAAMTAGSGLSILFTSMDSTLLSATLLGTSVVDSSYVLGASVFVFIMTVATFITSIIITMITEGIIAPKMSKYEFEEVEEVPLGKSEYRGLILALGAGFIYLVIFIYNIIPGLPFSGNLLENSGEFYIDKLFSFNSFFSNGSVFVITILFVIWGLFYGIGAKTIKNNNDVSHCLGHSLDGTGRTIVYIFFAATFISIFKATNIGIVVMAALTNFFGTLAFQGFSMVVVLFLISLISSIFLPSPITRWAMISGVAVPMMMNAGISPEYAQVIFRFGGAFMGLTPLFAYFIIYLAYMEKYNQEERPIALFQAIRLQLPYSLAVAGALLVIIIIWYLVGLPIGIEGATVL